MRIVAAEVIPYALRFREPYATARGTLERREMVLVRLRTDDGLDGLGEAVPLALRGGPALGEVARALRDGAAELVGRELGDAAVPGGWQAPESVPAPARAALDVSLQDLAAKAAGLPLWRFLGAEHATPVRCNATLVAAEPRAVAAQAAGWAD